MHEYALTKQIVKIVNGAAADNNAQKVNAAFLAVGESSGIIPESVQMYFDMIARGTRAEGAALHVRIVRAGMLCPECGKIFARPRFSFACPDCGAQGNPAGTGSECYVESVELETV